MDGVSFECLGNFPPGKGQRIMVLILTKVMNFCIPLELLYLLQQTGHSSSRLSIHMKGLGCYLKVSIIMPA